MVLFFNHLATLSYVQKKIDWEFGKLESEFMFFDCVKLCLNKTKREVLFLI